MGLYDGNQAAIIPAHLLTGSWPGLIEALQGFDLIAHNGKFDLVTLCSQLGDTRISLKLTWDTMLMHYVLWPASQQGLKPVAKQVLGVDDWETFEAFERLSRHVYPQREQWYEKAYPALLRAAELGGKKMDMTRVGDYHPTMVHLYNAYDVYYTHLMWGYLHPILNMNIDATQAYNHLIRFSNWIQVDEADGFPVDLRKTGQLRAPYATQVDQHRRELIAWAHQYVPSEEFPKGEFNPNSWQQVMKLYSRVGRTLSSTDEKTMGKLVEKGDQFAAKLLEYRSAKKLLSTYLDRIISHNNTIHGEPRMYPWYNLTSTVTGRLSSSGGTNIQNWPKQEDVEEGMRLRTVYVPSGLDQHGNTQDRALAQVDYSQAELRVAAALSGDEWLSGIFSDPSVDIFTQMTREIFPHIEDEDEIKRWRRPLKSCVPLNTKILTKRGWLSHDEVRVGDETPGLDGIGRTRWTKITKIHHPGVQQVYRYGNSSWSFEVTEDHRWAVGRRRKNLPGYQGIEMLETKDIPKERALHVAGALDDESSLGLTDEEVQIIAWVQSDGFLNISPLTGRTAQGNGGRRRGALASIMQAKPQYVQEIKSLLCDVPHSVDTRPGMNYETAYTFRLRSDYTRDLWTRAGLMDGGIEDFILRLSPHHRRLWLDVFHKAEGHIDSQGTKIITQKAGEKLDALILCASLCGERPAVSLHSEGGDVYKVRLCSVRHVTTQRLKMIPIREEEVWCVTTELGTWTAKQGNTVAVTGNCIYGLMFGRGATAIGVELGIPVADAKLVMSRFLGMAKELSAWREQIMHDVVNGTPIVTRFGRHFQHEVITNRNKAAVRRSALSFLPQSTSSDIMLTAYMDMREWLSTRDHLDWRFRALVHDAVTWDVPVHEVGECISTTQRFMIDAAKRIIPEVPFAVDGKWADNWSQTG